ncbi:hypothetical protein F0Q45_15795 [Mycobacterium simiae]|uniref:Uncharacterized protein n=1 Tax=Mycobacterium simiae TaxID=1784 RepID=A0A5B1BPT9_MYCSI|nr:hypothetical protein [Mycobacterium simiae]KAA1249333.1 hypothetical protein F0Q45_15795 [Mycobacterium simiae]
MNKSKLLAIGAELALIATTMLYLSFHELWIAFTSVALAAATVVLVGRVICGPRQKPADGRTVGVGTVHTVAAGERQIWIEVASVHGDTFIGRLVRDDDDPDTPVLRPGLVVLVAFDPTDRENLSLPDDVLAVRARGLTFV